MTLNINEKDELKIDVSSYSHLSIDAEWSWLLDKEDNRNGKKADFITVQCGFSKCDGVVGLIVIFWNSKYPTPTPLEVNSLENSLNIEITIVVTDLIEKDNLLKFLSLPKTIDILMFYSPKDLQGLLGREMWREMLLEKVAGKKTVNKRRRLNVNDFHVDDGDKECKVSVIDLVAMFNLSLDEALKSIGIDNPYKELASKNGRDKSKMDLFVNQSTEEFLQYSIGDVLYLHKAMILRTDQINDIVNKALGIGEIYSLDNVKLSSGSLVADVFEKWLMIKYPDLFKAVMMLTVSSKDKDWPKLIKIRNKIKTCTNTEIEKYNHDIKYMDSAVHGLAAASIKAYYQGNYGTGTVVYGAVVQGGRCVNERPNTTRIENVLDPDLASCYGSALKDFDYPFGLPTVYGRDIDDTKLTLGEFLNKNEKELVEGLYQIYVSGELDFHQDFVHSKYSLSTKEIASKLFKGDFEQDSEFSWEREEETSHIGGDFVLTTKEIELGIITSDNLKVIRSVSSNSELKGWMSLTADCAVYYPKSMELTIEDFIKVVNNDKTRGQKLSKSDTRTNHWCRLSLEDFIGQFIVIRNEFKKLKKQYPISSEEYKENDLEQQSCKLFVNTTYGCLASPYFTMGNTVLANNITAKARTGSWMMAKALNCVQIVTDGGLFSVDEVHELRIKKQYFYKPGFNHFYLRNEKKWTDNVATVPLLPSSIINEVRDALDNNDLDLVAYYQTKLDNDVTNHINNFWCVYGLKLPFSLEIKIDNTGYCAGYTNSADYCIDIGHGNYIIKTRGAKPDEHPKKLYLIALANQTPVSEVPHIFMDSKSLGVSEFQNNPGDVFLPGDDIDTPITLMPQKNSGCLYPTKDEWKRAKNTHDQAVRRYKKQNESLDLNDWDKFPTLR